MPSQYSQIPLEQWLGQWVHSRLNQISGTQTGLEEVALPRPQTEEELYTFVRDIVGITIPRHRVCPNHQTPWDAFKDAYFGLSPVAIWKASRAFGGKSVLLSTLTYTEAISLGAAVNLLGGSGEQAQRVHDYIRGETDNLPDTLWEHPRAPKWLLASDPSGKRTALTNGGKIVVLMASQKSVRGPHPQRLRVDEADEADIDIIDSALGQPLPLKGILDQTVLSSTHQYPDGTMTELLDRAKERDWPVYEWCWKETSHPESGWLTQQAIDRKRMTVTNYDWKVEYDLQAPKSEELAIFPETIEMVFRDELGIWEGDNNEIIIAEEPQIGGFYAFGIDWARKNDYTIIVGLRYDCFPARLVYFRRLGRQPWPTMIEKAKSVKVQYDKWAKSVKWMHDATGLGDVVAGYMPDDIEPFIMTGGQKTNELLSDYIVGMEQSMVHFPHIRYMKKEHARASVADVYKGYGTGHLPDTLQAGAFAFKLTGLGKKLKKIGSWRPK